MGWIDKARDRDRWLALMNVVLNIQVLNSENFLTILETISLSRRTQLHEVVVIVVVVIFIIIIIIIITNSAIVGLSMFNRQVSYHEHLKAGRGLMVGSERESSTWQL